MKIPEPPNPLGNLTIEIEQEVDGRWIADVVALPGVMVYGATRDDVVQQVKALPLRVLADRIKHPEDL